MAKAKQSNKHPGGRPPLSEAGNRQLIAIRLDPKVLEALRKEAKGRGIGYQTLINDVLARHVNQSGSRRRLSSHNDSNTLAP
jgi:uncharacterized protein (DUF4415 family)